MQGRVWTPDSLLRRLIECIAGISCFYNQPVFFCFFLMKYNPIYKRQYLRQFKLNIYESFWTIFRVSQDDPTQQGWPNYLQLQSWTINILQVWPYSWCTSNHTRELKIGIQLRDDPILQNSSHEPSTSSKYNCVLD